MTSRQIITLLRPHTLIASIAPVLAALFLAYCSTQELRIIPAILCLAVAIFAQMLSNVANDLFDFKKGADTTNRKGFERILSTGKVSYKEVKNLTILLGILTTITGLSLLFFSSWHLLISGILIIQCAICYTGGSRPLAYNGLGEVTVFLFFGLIATICTYYIQTGDVSIEAFFLACAFGFASANILVVNNYRDYEEDKKVKKNTIVVLLGRNFGKGLFIFNVVASTISLLGFATKYSIYLYALLFEILYSPYKKLKRYEGEKLNKVLIATSKRILFLLLFSFIFIYLYYTPPYNIN